MFIRKFQSRFQSGQTRFKSLIFGFKQFEFDFLDIFEGLLDTLILLWRLSFCHIWVKIFLCSFGGYFAKMFQIFVGGVRSNFEIVLNILLSTQRSTTFVSTRLKCLFLVLNSAGWRIWAVTRSSTNIRLIFNSQSTSATFLNLTIVMLFDFLYVPHANLFWLPSLLRWGATLRILVGSCGMIFSVIIQRLSWLGRSQSRIHILVCKVRFVKLGWVCWNVLLSGNHSFLLIWLLTLMTLWKLRIELLVVTFGSFKLLLEFANFMHQMLNLNGMALIRLNFSSQFSMINLNLLSEPNLIKLMPECFIFLFQQIDWFLFGTLCLLYIIEIV